jgi:hypothetical protein
MERPGVIFIHYELEHSGHEYDYGIKEFASKHEAEEFLQAKLGECPTATQEDFIVIEGRKLVVKAVQLVTKLEIQ